MKASVEVGQIWRDLYNRHTDELRLVRIDKIETKTKRQEVLGMVREIQYQIARISSKTGGETTFTPVSRFIKVDRFGKFYRLQKGS
ncbi:hypothetical protein FV222_00360 [Methylobacterium sp. WL103]|uniref:hypothetical protein n=1 Tax=Methylobacterium sp. WL103 TaxID=2603891 RepID=UPI0011CBF5FD|nr:hypothetical protein [Methylobacterium sp. WL103]TXN08957.1 hypothetical protein FV222_00360 [Methylobacterium sp. WL103]